MWAAKHCDFAGSAARVHLRLGERTGWFNDTGPLGHVVIDFGQGEVAIKRTENLPTMSLDDDSLEAD